MVTNGREISVIWRRRSRVVVALVRLEARSAVEGESVALGRLASRIDALAVSGEPFVRVVGVVVPARGR